MLSFVALAVRTRVRPQTRWPSDGLTGRLRRRGVWLFVFRLDPFKDLRERWTLRRHTNHRKKREGEPRSLAPHTAQHTDTERGVLSLQRLVRLQIPQAGTAAPETSSAVRSPLFSSLIPVEPTSFSSASPVAFATSELSSAA